MSDSLWAAELIEAFRRDKPDAARLGELASLAVRIDAPLLRALRHELCAQADPGVEADLWFSPLVQARDREACVLHDAVLLALREDLAKQPPLLARAAQVVKRTHTYLPEAVRLEEELTALALSGAADARIDEALRPALRALVSEGGAGPEREAQALEVARWAMGASTRVPARLRSVPAMQMLLLGSALRLEHPGLAAVLPDTAVPIERLSWLVPATTVQKPARIGAALLANGVLFEAPLDGTVAIELPATNPALVSVRWTDGTRSHSQMVNAAPGVMVETGTAPSSIEIVTLAGDVYRLMAGSATAPSHNGESRAPPAESLASEEAESDPSALFLLERLIEVEPLRSNAEPQVAIPVDEALWITSAERFADMPFLAPRDDGPQLQVLNAYDRSVRVLVLRRVTPREQQSIPQADEKDATRALRSRASRSARPALAVGALQSGRRLLLPAKVIGRGTGRQARAVIRISYGVDKGVIGAPVLSEGQMAGMVLRRHEEGDPAAFEVADLREIHDAVDRATQLRASRNRLEGEQASAAQPSLGRIYITYAQSDMSIAQRIAYRLIARGLNPFVSLTGIEGVADWQAELTTILRESVLMLALVTPAYLKKRSMTRELDLARDNGIPVLLVLHGVDSERAAKLLPVSPLDPYPLDQRNLVKSVELLALHVEHEALRNPAPVVSEMVDTVPKKHVLILGRFTAERKPVLDAVKVALRERGYLSTLFSIEKPPGRDLTETITMLARMSHFIIADLTDPRSVPQELASIVPDLPSVPVAPVILATERPYAMFERLQRYAWVLPVVRYKDGEDLLKKLPKSIIDKAERRRSGRGALDEGWPVSRSRG